MFDALEAKVRDPSKRLRLVAAAAEWARRWDHLGAPARRSLLKDWIQRIDLGSQTVSVSLYPGPLPALLLTDELPSRAKVTLEPQSESVLTLTLPARLKRAGMEMRLLIDGAGGGSRTKSDHSLCRLLAQAYRYQAVLLNSRAKTLDEVAAQAGVTRSPFRRVLRVSFLAPDIVQGILHDRHSIELNAERLAKNTVLRCSWSEQRTQLGFE